MLRELLTASLPLSCPSSSTSIALPLPILLHSAAFGDLPLAVPFGAWNWASAWLASEAGISWTLLSLVINSSGLALGSLSSACANSLRSLSTLSGLGTSFSLSLTACFLKSMKSSILFWSLWTDANLASMFFWYCCILLVQSSSLCCGLSFEKQCC